MNKLRLVMPYSLVFDRKATRNCWGSLKQRERGWGLLPQQVSVWSHLQKSIITCARGQLKITKIPQCEINGPSPSQILMAFWRCCFLKLFEQLQISCEQVISSCKRLNLSTEAAFGRNRTVLQGTRYKSVLLFAKGCSFWHPILQ